MFFGAKVRRRLALRSDPGHGINRPSLYAAFGQQGAALRKVLDRYMDGPVAYFQQALAAPKAREVVEEIFLGTARMADDPRIPAGCLMVQGALACGNASARKEVAARRAASEAALRHRLQRAKREGDLPKTLTLRAGLLCNDVVARMAVQSAGAPVAINFVASRKWHYARGRSVKSIVLLPPNTRPSRRPAAMRWIAT